MAETIQLEQMSDIRLNTTNEYVDQQKIEFLEGYKILKSPAQAMFNILTRLGGTDSFDKDFVVDSLLKVVDDEYLISIANKELLSSNHISSLNYEPHCGDVIVSTVLNGRYLSYNDFGRTLEQKLDSYHFRLNGEGYTRIVPKFDEMNFLKVPDNNIDDDTGEVETQVFEISTIRDNIIENRKTKGFFEEIINSCPDVHTFGKALRAVLDYNDIMNLVKDNNLDNIPYFKKGRDIIVDKEEYQKYRDNDFGKLYKIIKFVFDKEINGKVYLLSEPILETYESHKNLEQYSTDIRGEMNITEFPGINMGTLGAEKRLKNLCDGMNIPYTTELMLPVGGYTKNNINVIKKELLKMHPHTSGESYSIEKNIIAEKLILPLMEIADGKRDKLVISSIEFEALERLTYKSSYLYWKLKSELTHIVRQYDGAVMFINPNDKRINKNKS